MLGACSPALYVSTVDVEDGNVVHFEFFRLRKSHEAGGLDALGGYVYHHVMVLLENMLWLVPLGAHSSYMKPRGNFGEAAAV